MLEGFDTAPESAVLSSRAIRRCADPAEDSTHLKEDEEKDGVRS